jgi:hypothetical protein
VQYFPVPGHSFLPCDRDFGIISKALRAHDRLYSPEQVKDVIVKSSSIPGKFYVHLFCAQQFLDLKNWMKKYYKKSCISNETKGKKTAKKDKVSFQISTLHHFEYDSSNKGNVKAFTTIDGVICHNFSMGKSKLVFPPTQPAHALGFVTIKRAKLED